MKNKRGVITKRQQQILQTIIEKKKVLVDVLARKYSVSPLTIRRDLDLFAKQGFVKRFYGGASLIQGTVLDDPSKNIPAVESSPDVASNDYRRIVAREAAKLIQEDETIFINSSSTAATILEYITGKRITVITNNCNVLSIPHDPLISIIFTGGELTAKKKALVGDFAISTIKKVQVDKCFIGVSGITSTGEISTSVLQETMINTLMIEHTKGDVVIVADHTRIGKLNNFIIADINQVSKIVTDSLADPAIIEKLREKVQVFLAE